MRFHLVLNGADPRDFAALAAAAQAAGWDGLALNEGTFQPIVQIDDDRYPYTADGRRSWTPETPYLEPMTILPALGMQFPALRLLTWVLKLPLREPLTFSKQLATAALMTAGRLDLGVGLSWMRQEFGYTGIDWSTRRRRFVEEIEVLRLLLSGEPVEYHGEVFDFGPTMIRPVPTDPVRFILAGHGPKALDLAATIGDGWCGVLGPRAALEPVLAALRERLDSAGRDRASYLVAAGAVEAETADDFVALARQGLTDAIVIPWGAAAGGASSDPFSVPLTQRIDSIHRFAEDVIKPLSTVN